MKPPNKERNHAALPEIKAGHYSDGSPLDDVHYLECKLILKPDHFTSVPSFLDFGAIVRRTAKDIDIGFSTDRFKGLRPRIREVIFLDTRDFALYNHAFILRRRSRLVHLENSLIIPR